MDMGVVDRGLYLVSVTFNLLLVSAVTRRTPKSCGRSSPTPGETETCRLPVRKRGSSEKLHEGKRRRLDPPSSLEARFQALERMFLRLRRDRKSWMPVSQQGEVTVWKDATEAMLMGKVDLAVDPTAANAVLMDDYGGLLRQCFSTLITSVESKTIDDQMRILGANLKGFWPVPPRDCRILQRGRALPNAQGFICVGASIESPPKESFIRASVSLLGMLIEPSDPSGGLYQASSSKLTVLIKASTDGFIPTTLSDRIIKELFPAGLANLAQRLSRDPTTNSTSITRPSSTLPVDLYRVTQRLDAVEARLKDFRTRQSAQQPRSPLDLADFTPWMLSGSALFYMFHTRSLQKPSM